ncbi:ScbA/BarX family gamma-butyrolactone biosynthesis protein [Streptomyces sp. NPDC056144]|uniref:ScbA/BarX family gamma-butyrolactone biosynthesis protein n=1 Tax=unclassified Streptomyces TaxID=2593676 RepID=UPI0035D6C95D
MTTAPEAATQALPELDYTRTVDRLLVHRDALGEVFLTDLQPIDDESYAAAGQLPRSHAYYGDHLLRPAHHDPLLILETCRQAALAGAHRFFGVPADNKFILTHLTLRIDEPQAVFVGSSPLRLAMRVRISSRRERAGRVTGLDYDITLSSGTGAAFGTASVGLRFKDPGGYLTLRLNNRDGMALPSSAAYPSGTPGAPVAPHLVGRANPDNVVLLDGVVVGDSAQALLRIPARHASLFDHPQDHLPGMVIAEGARQLALFAALDIRGLSTSKTLVTSLDVRFTRFGELEDDTVLSAVVGELGGPVRPYEDPADHTLYTLGGILTGADEDGHERVGEGAWRSEDLKVRVEATQKGEELCSFAFTLTRIPA